MLSVKEPLDLECRRELQVLVQGKILFDVAMGPHTTFGVGGPADVWIEPENESDLARVLAFCEQRGIARYVIGQGTNLLVKDGGIRGIVLRLRSPFFRSFTVEGIRVTAGTGLSNTKFLEALKSAELAGMEFICGIPGGVGGGVVMNAGALGGCYEDRLAEIRVMDSTGKVRRMGRDALQFEYRRLRNLGDAIVLSATFDLAKDARDRIAARAAEMLEIRNATQPKGSNPGCVFKNPVEQSAGKIIDTLGLKGLRVGGACVSTLHGNFILNDRKASSSHVLELIEKIQAEVLARMGIHLETEVKILGD